MHETFIGFLLVKLVSYFLGNNAVALWWQGEAASSCPDLNYNALYTVNEIKEYHTAIPPFSYLGEEIRTLISPHHKYSGSMKNGSTDLICMTYLRGWEASTCSTNMGFSRFGKTFIISYKQSGLMKQYICS